MRWAIPAMMFPKTLWFAPDLTLVVQDYGTAILFAMGPGSVREALESVAPVHLQVRRDALDEVTRHAAVSSPRLMWRIMWTGIARLRLASHHPAGCGVMFPRSRPVCRRRVLRRVARFLLSLDGGRRRVPWDP